MSRDLTPPSVDVWVCPTCGHWQKEMGQAVHAVGWGGMLHELVPVTYIWAGDGHDAVGREGEGS